MTSMKLALVAYPKMAARHPAVAALIFLLAVRLIWEGVVEKRVSQIVAYSIVIALSVLITDTFTLWQGLRNQPVPVRHPQREVALAGVLFFFSMIALLQLFGELPRTHSIASQGFLNLLRLAVIFNIPLAALLLSLKYTYSDLGFRWRGIVLVPLIVFCFGLSSMVIRHSSITWAGRLFSTAFARYTLFVGLLQSALPEEFFRWVWQTRLATWMKNRATGWLAASVLWAALHGPMQYAGSPSHSIAQTAVGLLNTLSIGLLWGYITVRTQSLIPSMIIHATNIWGLQNL